MKENIVKENIMAGLLMIFGISTFLSIIFVIVSVPVYYLDRTFCYTQYSDYAPQFSYFGGCRIVWNEKLTPVENVGFRDFTQTP
jgi:hypothetical protein